MGIVTGAAAAYLVGCVPVARFVSYLARGRPWAPLAARLADFAKGFSAIVLFAPVSSVGQALTLTALVAADQWPAVGKETGRLGLWAAAGAMTALTPVAPLVWGVLWAIGFVASGYLVAGRLLALVFFSLALGFVAGWPLGLISLPACVMVLERSRADFGRVVRGEEAKHHWRDDG
jgi:glycerol-3-phosphate acyltransferase PlsY